MNKYIATVRIQGRSVKTAVFADNSISARLLLQHQFGRDSLVTSPSATTDEQEDLAFEVVLDKLKKPRLEKPLTLPQANIANLQRQKQAATAALNKERTRQKVVKAQQQIGNAIQKI